MPKTVKQNECAACCIERKKYKIRFTKDYAAEAELANNSEDDYLRKYYAYQNKRYPERIDFCLKWRDKEITILELEQLIDEFEDVVFDGETIEIYNDHRE